MQTFCKGNPRVASPCNRELVYVHKALHLSLSRSEKKTRKKKKTREMGSFPLKIAENGLDHEK